MKRQLTLYLIFAAISTAVNFLTLQAMDRALSGWLPDGGRWASPGPSLDFADLRLFLSQCIAILAGFVVKYFLDKRYVFEDKSENLKQEARKVTLYGMMSVITTLILFGFSWTFKVFISRERAKDVGWLLGLVAGYSVKFLLDRRYVFRK